MKTELTTRQKKHIHRLAQVGVQELLDQAAAPLNPEERQIAATEIYRIMVALLPTFVTLETQTFRSAEPSAN
jgi:hypothetical protein